MDMKHKGFFSSLQEQQQQKHCGGEPQKTHVGILGKGSSYTCCF